MAILGGSKSTYALGASLLLSTLLPSVQAAVPSSSFVDNKGNNNVSLAINVPAGNNNQDLYFHFEAPLNGHQWAGFGIGKGMSSSAIFVAYKSEGNQGEPIVSTRIGFGHAMPQYTTDFNVSVFSSSYATDDRISVDFHCNNCRKWSSGSINVTDDDQPFFYALGPSGDLETNDQNAKISQHSADPVQFALNMKDATGPNGVPVIGSAADHPTDAADRHGLPVDLPRIFAFHGFVMSLAFLIIWPLGYLFLRLFEKVWLHWGLQSIGLLFVLAGIAAGVVGSKREDVSPNLTHPHQIIGLIIAILALATWTMGLIGHSIYKKRGVLPPVMRAHRFAGPITILLGYVNACIGLVWAGIARGIAFFLGVGLIVWIIVGGLVFMKKRRNTRKRALHTPAANNFREGQLYDPPLASQAHPADVHGYSGVPMQNMDTEYNSAPQK